ncbi:MAG: hypothetical protein RIR70_279 [Pseudomonadota bacterium]|jgi:hypothetical protein
MTQNNAYCDTKEAGERTAHKELLSSISESELTDFVANGAVKHLHLIQTEAGKYQIVINLTWKKGDWHLMTSRGKAREWASLDRLVRHIREKYDGAIPPISLSLYRPPHRAGEPN